MKEAFEKVHVIEVKGNKKKKGIGIRDRWWRYPYFIERVVKNSKPVSYILLFSIFGFLLCTYIMNEEFVSKLKTKETDTFTEGSVGAISSLNPIFLTQNPIDKSIYELVFEKFINVDKDGNPIPGIATSWTVSDDNLIYTFDISEGHMWQDGVPLSMDDVIFTFDSALKLAEKYGEDSVGVPLSGVKIEKIDKNTIRFTLKNTNAIFFEAVSIYVLPKHRLENINLGDLKFNIFTKYPLGSGPYKVVKSEPNIVVLEASQYYPSKISIPKFTYRIYDDLESLEVAFRNGELDAISGVNSGGMNFVYEYSGYKVLKTNLEQRTRMIFFNTRRDSLSKKEIRQALNYITDKRSLLEKSGIPGEIALGVISSASWAFNPDAVQYAYNPEVAKEIFNKLGYTKNEKSGYYEGKDNKILSFTLSYLDNALNTRLVTTLEQLWRKEGVILKSEPLTYDQITQEVISTRNFEMLLYEVETTVDPDQYNLWHSLKKDYPDQNLSGYDYERVDILLEEGRTETDKSIRKEKYFLFQKYLMNDAPAIFLYHPEYIYVVPSDLNGPDLTKISYPQERFKNITEWTF